MTVETYIIGWNREDTIHLSIKHYKKLGNVIYFDNFSTDRTREIAESLGADVRLFGRAGELDDQTYLDIKNHAWKRSNADWVIVVDDDEILYHPNLNQVLFDSHQSGATIFRVNGFNIHSDLMPKEDWTEITTGEKNENYSKLCVFNPRNVTDIRYNYGCHASRPVGNLVYADTKLALLHYREVGGVERLIARHKLYRDRLSDLNKRYNLGHHYTETEESKRKQWNDFTERCGTLYEAGIL
jgi:glycosyltransferase involved in cell wall biosynthesis